MWRFFFEKQDWLDSGSAKERSEINFESPNVIPFKLGLGSEYRSDLATADGHSESKEQDAALSGSDSDEDGGSAERLFGAT